MNLSKLTEENAPHPLSEMIQGLQLAGGGNANVIAQNIALRSCPVSELPLGLRDPRKKFDAAEKAKSEAEAELSARMSDWQRHQNMISEIEDRQKHLGFAEERLVLAKDAAAQLPANFLAVERIGNPQTWASTVELIRDAVICERLAELLPIWIEQESAAIAKLERESEQLAAKYS